MPNAADIDSIKNEVIQSLDKLNQKELIDDKDFTRELFNSPCKYAKLILNGPHSVSL